MDSRITEYIYQQEKWTQELNLLRSVLLELPLQEDIKWGIPAYLYKKKNILGLSAFKNYCGIWFHQGVFLQDKAQVLINAQKDKTKAMRQLRFTSLDEIDTELVRQYVVEAIENCEAGKELKPQRNTKPLHIPDELASELAESEKLQYKFNEFSLSKKREFCEYISSAKRQTTKENRLEKIITMILNGQSLHDKYRNC